MFSILDENNSIISPYNSWNDIKYLSSYNDYDDLRDIFSMNSINPVNENELLLTNTSTLAFLNDSNIQQNDVSIQLMGLIRLKKSRKFFFIVKILI